MSIRVAINGFGRIGRHVLRALYEANRQQQIQVVAINDLASPETMAHLLKYDSTHGPFAYNVSLTGATLQVGADAITLLSERNPEALPWEALQVDVVLECSGHFTKREGAEKHLKAGAKKVLVSAPGQSMDKTIVYGVNHQSLSRTDTIVSNASCTTNALAPLLKPLHEAFEIESGLMTTIHAFTNDQVLSDMTHSDLRRARSAVQSMIPTKTGAASSVGLVLPELNGKLDGFAMRVPTLNVSVVDLSVVVKAPVTIESVNQVLEDASNGMLKGVLAVTNEPLVSVDFNHHPASSIVDMQSTKVQGQLVKVLSWYDNEWGFANRMLDTLEVLMNAE